MRIQGGDSRARRAVGPGWALAVACSLILAAGASSAQVLPEIPLTLQMPTNARYAGMGGASLAFADDHTACLANPATLALVRQIELSAGLSKQSGRMDATYFGDTERSEFGKARLSDLGFAYPFPTYRGSLVAGFSYGRISSLDSGYYRQGSGGLVDSERESIIESGGLGAYGMSLAFQATRSIWLGATGTILSGSSYQARTFHYRGGPGGAVSADSYTTLDSDIKAVSGNLGLLVDVAPGARLGIAFQLPAHLNFDGVAHEEFFGGDSIEDYSFTDEIDLPFRVGAGLAVTRSHLILAGDAIYTDWTAIDFAGPVTSGRDQAYRETVELKFGAEYLLSAPTPIRLRAGYAYMPLSYGLLLTQRTPTGGANSPIETSYEDANITKDRQYWTVGAGVLLAEALTLDIAYMDGGFTRSGSLSGPSVYEEKQKDRRLLATLSLRLPFDRD